MAQHVTGSGFTPGGPVELDLYLGEEAAPEHVGSLSTTADAGGAIDLEPRLPQFDQARASALLVATDATLQSQGAAPEAYSGSFAFDASQWDIDVARWASPARGKPGRRTKIVAMGWVGTASTTLYAHYLRGGKLKKTVRVGALTGTCADFDGRMKEFPFKAKAGTYRVVFDTTRAYPNQDASIFYRRVKVARAASIRASATLADPIARLRTTAGVAEYR